MAIKTNIIIIGKVMEKLNFKSLVNIAYIISSGIQKIINMESLITNSKVIKMKSKMKFTNNSNSKIKKQIKLTSIIELG